MTTINVASDGTIQFIWSDDLQPLTELGETTTKRVSHVEPAGGGWTADLSPVAGPVLGPFKLRQQALDAEFDWLERNGY